MQLCGIQPVDDEHLLLQQTLGLLTDSLIDNERAISRYWYDFRDAAINHMRGETQFFHLLPRSAAATHLASHAHIMALFQTYRVDAPDPGRTNLQFLMNMVIEHTSCPEELLLMDLLTTSATS